MASAYLIEDQNAPMFVEILSKPEAAQYPDMRKILRYFHKTWIQTFLSKMWNVQNRPTLLRTTNFCESWNRIWNRKVQRHSLNLWLVILFLKQQEKIVENPLELIRMGKPAPKQTRK